MKKAIIVDIDGTIATHEQRGHFDFDQCDTDSPVKPIIDIVSMYYDLGLYTIIFVTGREDSCKEKTVEWLKKHVLFGLPWDDDSLLFMRKTGDHRPDYEIKKEIYLEHIKDKFEVLFVLDDRDQVVRMWRKQGLTCLQVADGNF